MLRKSDPICAKSERCNGFGGGFGFRVTGRVCHGNSYTKRLGAAPQGQCRRKPRDILHGSPRTHTHLVSRQPARAPHRLTSTAGRPRWTERMRAFSSCWGSMPGILVPDSPSGDAFYAPARNQVTRRPLHQQAVRRGAPSAISQHDASHVGK